MQQVERKSVKSAGWYGLIAAVAAAIVLAAYPATVASMPQSASPPAVPDVRKLGPQVGERVPDFTLNDQQGRSHTLTSLLGPGGLMLVFFRSADW
jgi:hypothetical protein